MKKINLIIVGLCAGLFYLGNISSQEIVVKDTIKTAANDIYASTQLKEKTVTSNDGLYKDEYEQGRYIYKGANVDNYIMFNNELWRIISLESDGTLKIMKNTSVGAMAWDLAENNDWTTSTLNTYLNNDYYNTLESNSMDLIQKHNFGIGTVVHNNTDINAQIKSENTENWNGNIGLISVSDFIRANSNKEQCGDFASTNRNSNVCPSTNYINSKHAIWTITRSTQSSFVFSIYFDRISSTNSMFTHDSGGSNWHAYPVVYIKSDVHLEGKGNENNPYIIKKGKFTITDSSKDNNAQVVKVPSTGIDKPFILTVVGLAIIIISGITIWTLVKTNRSKKK